MTVAMWFQVGVGFPDGSDGGDRLWTNNQTDPNNAFQITLGGSSNLIIGINPALNGFPGAGLPSGSGVGNFQIPTSELVVKDGEWHHIVASRSGNDIEDVIVVIDGVHFGVDTWADSTDTWGTTGTDAQIGTRTPGDGGASSHAMNGSVDEVAIWLGSQLSIEESIALYNAAVSGGLLGDYNGDGSVTAADYTVWADTFGSTTDLRADGNGDGDITAADYTIWRRQLRCRCPGGCGARAFGFGSARAWQPATGSQTPRLSENLSR